MAPPARCGQLLQRLVRRKHLSDARSMETPLHRGLSAWHLMFYGIGITVGAGIFVLTGEILKHKAGPAGSISLLIGGAACLVTALCYIELATLAPRAGSSYLYTYITLGELPAFVVGWTMISDQMVTIAAGAKSFSVTLDTLTYGAVTNFTIAHLGALPPWGVFSPTYDFVSVALIAAMTLVNIASSKLSLTINMAMCIPYLLCLLFIGVCCFVFGSAANWAPEAGGFFPFGFSGVLKGTSIGLFAFSGFEHIVNASEETKNPGRSVPRAILGCLAVTTALYLLASLGLSYLRHYSEIDVGSPFVEAFRHSGAGTWVVIVAAVGSLLATSCSKLSGIFSTPRSLYAIASDGLLMPCFASVNKTVQVPLVGLAFSWLLTSLLSLLVRLEALANLVSMGSLIAYMMVGVNLFYLRYLLGADAECELRPWAARLAGGSLAFLRKRSAAKLLLLLYTIASFATGVAIHYVAVHLTWWSWLVTSAVVASAAALGFQLSWYAPRTVNSEYEAPLMPLPSLLTILTNAVLIASLPLITWLRLAVWTLLGLLIYCLYGYRNSHATDKGEAGYLQLQDKPDEPATEYSSLGGN